MSTNKINLADFGVKFTTRAFVPQAEHDEVDFTIVIAHKGPAMGLWATIHSCEIELTDSTYKYNYVIVPNGEEKWHIDEERVWRFLATTGKLRDLIKVNRPLSPPSARNMGAEMANGKYIFFFDNHCLVAKNYFKSAIETMESTGASLVHSLTRFYEGEKDHWHYTLCLEGNFWGGGFLTDRDKPFAAAPYRCAVGGHGGFAVTRKAWKEIGGYWEGFVGYGGEECYLDLGLWLTGHEVWLDPGMIHYHFAGERPYTRHYTDDYFRNMMMCARIIGDSNWMLTVHNSFCKSVRMKSDVPMFDLMLEADDKAKGFAAQFAARKTRTLDELLQHFADTNIPH